MLKAKGWVVGLAVALPAFAAVAMPTRAEFQKVLPLVREISAEDVAAVRAGKMKPAKAGDNAFERAKGKFRTYLSTIVRRILIDRARRLAVRFSPARALPLESAAVKAAETPDAAVLADLNWRIARHQAAVAHVFAKSALGEQARRIYVMSKTEGLSPTEIAQRLGNKPNAVRAVLSRVERMIAAVEGEYDRSSEGARWGAFP